jgi:transcription elongation factor GreA
MTATLTREDRRDALLAKLVALNAERTEALAEIVPGGVGDDADRATNVDGHVRLGMLERRIGDVEAELTDVQSAAPRSTDGTAAVGDVVSVDLGDGPEQYLLGSVEQAGPGVDVITPGSPLGRALIGASAGSTLEYAPRPHRILTATLLAID